MNELECFLVTEMKSQHSHEYAQIILPFCAPVVLRIYDQTYAISEHELGYVPPGQGHQCTCSQPLIVINLSSALLQSGFCRTLTKHTISAIHPEIEPILQLIKTEMARDANSHSIQYLYSYLYNKLLGQITTDSLFYLSNHFAESISIAELAAIENYSVTYYKKWFKKQNDLTPQQWIRQLRIKKAKELLAATKFTIVEIAEQVGYDSHSAFSRSFRALTGISPHAYRILCQAQQKGKSQNAAKQQQ